MRAIMWRSALDSVFHLTDPTAPTTDSTDWKAGRDLSCSRGKEQSCYVLHGNHMAVTWQSHDGINSPLLAGQNGCLPSGPSREHQTLHTWSRRVCSLRRTSIHRILHRLTEGEVWERGRGGEGRGEQVK